MVRMKNLFKAMNRYFFDDEEISLSDGLIYYGTLAFMGLSGLLALLFYIQTVFFL